MIPVLNPAPVTPRYSDPDESLMGRCMTCKAVIRCVRSNAQAPSDKLQLGAWNDLLSAECPSCGARVFVMAEADFLKLPVK